MKQEMTQIYLPKALREQLNQFKLVEREPYYSVIERLIEIVVTQNTDTEKK